MSRLSLPSEISKEMRLSVYHTVTEAKFPVKYCCGRGEREINIGKFEFFRTISTLKSTMQIVVAT